MRGSRPPTWRAFSATSTVPWCDATASTRRVCWGRSSRVSAGGFRRRPSRGGRCASRAAGCPATRSLTRRPSCGNETGRGSCRWPCSPTISRRTNTPPRPFAASPSGCSVLPAAALRRFDRDRHGVTAVRLLGFASGARRLGEGWIVGPVGNDLRAQRAAHALELRGHLPLELRRALAHPRHLAPGALELALEPEHGLDPREVEPLLGGHLLDPAQPLDVLERVEPGVLR